MLGRVKIQVSWPKKSILAENTLENTIINVFEILHLKKIIILLWYGGRLVHSRLIKCLFRTDLTSL